VEAIQDVFKVEEEPMFNMPRIDCLLKETAASQQEQQINTAGEQTDKQVKHAKNTKQKKHLLGTKETNIQPRTP
jgi:hypothetical protein